jgi:hypothetical protein
MLPVAHYDHIL